MPFGKLPFILVYMVIEIEPSVLACLLIAHGIVCAFVGSYFGEAKGRSVLGFFLGLFWGPLGWISLLLLPARPDVTAEYILKVRDQLTIKGVGADGYAREVTRVVLRELRAQSQAKDPDAEAFREFRNHD